MRFQGRFPKRILCHPRRFGYLQCWLFAFTRQRQAPTTSAAAPRWISTRKTISTSQRRGLQQLTAFVGGGGLPAVQQTGMNLDFSSSDAAQEARSNSVQLGGFFRCSERLEKSASH
jgi:hypothetical protein